VEAIHLCSTIAVVAERAARLCAAAEAEAGGNQAVLLMHEVPVPAVRRRQLYVEVTSRRRPATLEVHVLAAV